ncbi:hypothetical protein [Cytobacillus purgationiresistens]|uniref:LysM domain-containing protein n=1 Tax=Cytobacillus purgationiresistens TaxID=863449 RepID=A0ABU0AF30_9BACI|nr:hypothetical protein [Cytobacillus purgationiresistens]MDQ0269464.1 hypothetical protein [Cytobacillus purgationiresistens]
MRRFAAFILLIVVAYAIYFDLANGTLPTAQETTNEKPAVQTSAEVAQFASPFIEKEVSPGETVLSIVEKQNKGLENIPMNEIVSDFIKLNEGIKPEEIKYGKVYKFPTYTVEN